MTETGAVAGPGARGEPERPVLSVLMPVYNEIHTLQKILDRVAASPIDKEIVVVDDGSTDGSREWLVAEAPRRGLRLALLDRNQGKTAAVRRAIEMARGRVLLVQDADLEYDPAEYPRLVEPILDGRADVVFGSRFTGSPRRVLMFWHTVGNRLLTLLSNAVTNLNLTDMETCYKAFRADVLKRIPIRSSGFGFEAEVTVKIAQLECRVYEVPISYSGREYWEGKKITWRDGVQAVLILLRYGLWPDLGNDDLGFLTLRNVERLGRYNRFLWERLQPFVGRRVLEVGSGTGSITQFLVNRERLVATDPREDYRKVLEQRFAGHPSVSVEPFVLGEPAPRLASERFDTVVCSNVLEHVEDDVGALRQIHGMLAPGGRVVLVVPMLKALYGSIDRAIDHHRRYARQELREKLERSGYVAEVLRPFNAIGVPGWWLNSVVLRRKAVPGTQARLANWLVPWLRVESALRLPFGMSLLAVGRRPEEGIALTAAAPAPLVEPR